MRSQQMLNDSFTVTQTITAGPEPELGLLTPVIQDLKLIGI